jgi:ABC-type nitrate/sulfonate/bicarbonate transport system substrate-binding protein
MTGRIETLWYTRCPSPSASSIAITGGWLERAFGETEITVRSLRSSPDRSVRQSHFTQRHEALFRQGGIVPPLWAAAAGTATRLIGLSAVPRFQGVIALPQSGIDAPGDLRGRRLGLPRRTTEPVDFWRAHSWRGLLAALAVAGLEEGDVSWVDLRTDAPYHLAKHASPDASRLQSAEVMALVRGEVDAIYTYAPSGLALIELLGANVVVSLPASGPGSSGIGALNALTVSQRLLDERPDLVARYVATLFEAARWARSHVADSLRVFASEEGVAEEWAAASFGALPAFDLAPTLSAPLLGALQLEADFLAERELISKPVDVVSWSDDHPLQLARGQVQSSYCPNEPELQEELA